ncbi:hypothetical protein TCELL_0702 [Thermogladius calderae 1633]|uniref:Uncharacterized protein n=1 Tax=Thermogladius calderae (strain DSM 22663 / VKM B-2946 / 1633) TaxID=1184251 RepID=I3TED8_THEC1|nr:hypothetical protein [Thermogladius calderae]AFK51126.1 hypothetical protein TCELL_0702 [Thermogladius calderae 1633]
MVGVKAWLVSLGGLLILAGILLGLVAIPFASAQIQDQYRAPDNHEEEVEVEIANGTIAVRPAFNITFEQALKLAYDVRNVTYPLFEWEISHNVTAANVTLNLGDRFLERTLNLSSENLTKRAAVMAIVAAIHYGHAVPLAYPVLGKTLDALFNQNATSEQMTTAVINLASDLKSILTQAVSTAQSRNLTVPAGLNNLTELGDKLLSYAQSNLSAGNISLAFRLAIKAYHTYVKAYGLLVTSVFAQDLKLPTVHHIDELLLKEKFGRETLVKVFEKLPEGLKEVVITKIEIGEANETEQVVKVVREIALQWKLKVKGEVEEYIKNLVQNMVMNATNQSSMLKEIKIKFKGGEDEFRNAIAQIIQSGLSQNKTLGQIIDEISNYLSNLTNGKFNLKMEIKNQIHEVHVEVEHELENED